MKGAELPVCSFCAVGAAQLNLQGSYRLRQNWKKVMKFVWSSKVSERSEKNLMFEKSGK